MTDWRSRVRLYGSHDVDLCVPSRDAVTTTRRPLFRLYQPPTGTTTAPTTTPTTTVLTTTPTTTEFTTTPTTTAFTTATSTTTAPTTTISTQYVTPTIPTTDVTSQPPLPGDDSGIRDSEVLCLVLLLVIVVMLGVWCWRRCLWGCISVHNVHGGVEAAKEACPAQKYLSRGWKSFHDLTSNGCRSFFNSTSVCSKSLYNLMITGFESAIHQICGLMRWNAVQMEAKAWKEALPEWKFPIRGCKSFYKMSSGCKSFNNWMNGTIKSIYNSTQGFMGQKTVGPEVKAWKEAGPAWEYPPYTLAAKGTCLIQVDEHHLVAVFASDKTRTEDVGSKLIA